MMNVVEHLLRSRYVKDRLRECMRSGAVGGFRSGGFAKVTARLRARLDRYIAGKTAPGDAETPRVGESADGDKYPVRAAQVTKYVRAHEPRAKGATLYLNHYGAPYWADGVADGFHEQSVGIARVNRLTLGQYLGDFQARIEDSRKRRIRWGMEEASTGLQFRNIGGRVIPIGLRDGQAIKPKIKPKVKERKFKRADGTIGVVKQYDEKFRTAMQQYKFSRVAANRAKVVKALDVDLPEEANTKGITKERMAAVALLMMAHTGARPGNKRSKTDGRKTFGLTTIQKRHVHLDGDTVELRFRGKSGQPNTYRHTDPVLARAFRDFTKGKESTDEVFRYAAHSKGVLLDQHLRDRCKDISSTLLPKDLRTAVGTDVATKHILDTMSKKVRIPDTAAGQAKLFKKLQKQICKKVSRQLNNSPAMSKKAYIEPLLWGRMAAEMGFTKYDPNETPGKKGKKVSEAVQKSTTPDEFIRRAMYNPDMAILRGLLGDDEVDQMVDDFITSEVGDDDFYSDEDVGE